MSGTKLQEIETQEVKYEEEIHHEAEPLPIRHNRKLYTLIGAILLVFLLGGGGFLLKQKAASANLKATAEAKPALAPVAPDVAVADASEQKQLTVEAVTERTYQTEGEVTGKVAFNEDNMSPVFTPYAGRIVELLASKGDVVKRGQPLLIIEAPDLVVAENDLSAARSDVDKAKLALTAAERAHERNIKLHEREAIATKDLQLTENDLLRAKEDLRRAVASVNLVESRIAFFGKDAKEIEQMKTTGGKIDRRLTIRAPISGTIVERKIGPGQFIKPDLPDPMFLISDLSSVWVMADVYESNLSRIHVGAPVQVSVPAFPDRTFPARISFINPTVDAASRTVRVRCSMANPNGKFKPDMFAKIKIGATVPQSVVSVPSSAVIVQSDSSVAFIEEAPGKYRKQKVKTGKDEQGFTVIEAGLKTGDRIVTHGAMLLNNGLSIKKDDAN